MINKAEFNDENHLKAWLIVTAEHKALNVAKSARMKRTVLIRSPSVRRSRAGANRSSVKWCGTSGTS
ncbi:MAG: hypothetical protein ACLSG5_12610 [Oscillospiraceae bacterium]